MPVLGAFSSSGASPVEDGGVAKVKEILEVWQEIQNLKQDLHQGYMPDLSTCSPLVTHEACYHDASVLNQI